MHNRNTRACNGKRGYSETFNAFNRILIGEADAIMVLVAGAEARPGEGSARTVPSARGTGAFIPGTIFDLERTLPERSRVSGAGTRIHTDTRICRL